MTTRMMQFILLGNRYLHSDPAAAAPAPNPTDDADPPAAEPAAPTPGEEVDFAALSAEYEADENSDAGETLEPDPPVEPATQPTAAPAQTPPPAPAVPPATAEVPPSAPAAAPPVVPTATAPAAEPTAPAAPAAAPQPAAPATQDFTPESIAAAYDSYEKQILPQLEARYALSAEQAREIEENPSVAIPKLAARIHYQAQVAAYTGIMSQLPKIVSAVVEQRTAVEAAENAFYNRWPDLRKPEYAPHVITAVNAYKSANKNATQADIIEKAGMFAMLAAGLTPMQTPTAPTAPAAPSVPAVPHAPAGTSGSGPARTPAGGAGDFWGDLADDIQEYGI